MSENELQTFCKGCITAVNVDEMKEARIENEIVTLKCPHCDSEKFGRTKQKYLK